MSLRGVSAASKIFALTTRCIKFVIRSYISSYKKRVSGAGDWNFVIKPSVNFAIKAKQTNFALNSGSAEDSLMTTTLLKIFGMFLNILAYMVIHLQSCLCNWCISSPTNLIQLFRKSLTANQFCERCSSSRNVLKQTIHCTQDTITVPSTCLIFSLRIFSIYDMHDTISTVE